MSKVLGYGFLLDGEARGAVDAYRITDDPGPDASLLRATPAVAATLRWPLLRRGAEGTSDLLEPVVSLGWTGALGGEPPNEDARLPELDEANLHALSRLPGEDVVEEGGRLSLGLTWTRATPGGDSALSFGRVLRTEELEASEASGLDGTVSDWLVAGRVDLDAGFGFDARALFEEDLALGKSEAEIDWSGEALTLAAGYVRLPADVIEERADEVEELSVAARLRASEMWTLSGTARFDIARDEPERVGLGVAWRNECVEVDVSLAHRYTTAGDGEASTDFGLSVNLLGFSADGGSRVQPGACRD
jgi:LPS-assembly protein